jgi:hypothetical protein
MDMHSREQYLETLREEYRRADKKQKTRLLDEARRRTRLNRKVLIGKLAHPAPVKQPAKRRRRRKTYGAELKAPLAHIWKVFDFPCGQRLAAILRQEVDRLRSAGELRCSERVAELLKQASARTLDRLLAHEREVRQLKRQRRPPVHPLLYQRVPEKLPNEWAREQLGNLQMDFVLHGGRSTAGEYLHTMSVVDIASGWWEGKPQMGRSQKASQESFDRLRRRFPFRVREVHPDNDSALLSDLLWKYCRRRRIAMSRSRPYEKNDNAWVEQKNWTHVRKLVGYRRYDTSQEQEVLGELYRRWADYQNFFQPMMKLKEKTRVGGKVHRVYDQAQTPYRRVLAGGLSNRKQREELEARYRALNPVALWRKIQELRDRLFDLVEAKCQADLPRTRRRGPDIELTRARNQRLRAAAPQS